MLRSSWIFFVAGGLVIAVAVIVLSLPRSRTAPVPENQERLSITSLFDADDAPWDLPSIKAMTWEELGAVNLDLDGDGLFRADQQRYSKRLDLKYWQLEFEGGGEYDTYTMLSKGTPPPPEGEYVTVNLKHHAFVFLPDGYPDRSLKGDGHAVLYNIHEFPSSRNGGVHLRTEELGRALKAVQLYEIPVVLHGEKKHNWEQLGYTSQDDIMGASGLVTAVENSVDPDVFKTYYLYILMRQNLQAITLTGLILDRIEPRSTPGERISGGVLCRGSSKQGGTCLRLGMLGDDRIKILIPGRNHLLSQRSVMKYVEDWGFPYSRNHYPWIDDVEPHGYRGRLRNTVWSRLALAEWSIAARENEPGWVANEIFGAHNQISALGHIDLIAFYGQVGRYKSRRWRGERVDTFAEHDRQFTLGSETAFLDDLEPSQWRYAREKPDHADSPPRFYTRPDYHWLEAIHQLVAWDKTRWVKIVSADPELDGTAFTVRADLAVTDPHADDDVRLYYTLSEHNRCWNDWEQNGVETPGRPWHPWRSVPMRRLNPLRYEATVDVENSEWSIAWYVEAMHLIDPTATPPLRAFDSTAPRFERETPIKPENRGCSDVGAVKIERCEPNPAHRGDTVAIAIAFDSRRIPIHSELPDRFLEVQIDVDLMMDGTLIETHRMPLAKALKATNRTTLNWKVPDDLALGKHTLEVVVDPPGNAIGHLPEFDEENNRSAPHVVKVASR